ncbi:MAG: threonylcarbamoyl-AMP synthase TsaC [Pseudomonadota bacterium]
MVISSLAKLQKLTRVPQKYKSLVRRASKTTFIYPNKNAIRVVKDSLHNELLDKFDFLYSTSANESGKNYDEDFAKNSADIIIESADDFCETTPSKIYRLSKNKIQKIR